MPSTAGSSRGAYTAAAAPATAIGEVGVKRPMRARSGGRIDLRACACGVAVAEDLVVLLNHPVLDRVTTCVHRGLLSLGPTPLRE
nr:hypothetical protein JVH1_0241 [Rhodococcus sp. JVH1]